MQLEDGLKALFPLFYQKKLMENFIILQGISLDAFLKQIDKTFERRINEKLEELMPKKFRYLTRREVSEYFRVSLVTINDWTNKGYLISYRIGKRIFFKSDEVEKALVKRKLNR